MLRLFRLDAAQLRRDRLAVTVLVVGSIACLLAAVVGHTWVTRQEAKTILVEQAAASELDAMREQWAAAAELNPAEAVLLPTRAAFSTPLRRPLLPDFTVGRSSFEPTAATVRLTSRPDSLFTRYQVENPERIARGGVDLSFVVVVLAPLLLIGLGYGVFASDRDSGAARLWLAQAGSPLRLLAVRSFNRLALVCVPIAAASLALLLFGPDISGRWAAGGLWLATAFVGLLFWWAVILLVNSLRITAETAALALVAVWATLVFVIPGAMTSAAAILNPPPSRMEQIATARAAEVRASREFDDDHPELSFATPEGRRAAVVKGIEVRRDIAAAVGPLAQAHEERIAAQQDFLRRASILSPPALIADALSGVAATDLEFYAAQRGAVVDYVGRLASALGDVALGERSVSAATFNALPKFSAAPLPQRRWAPLAVVGLVSLLVLGAAIIRLRRIQPF